MRSRWSIVAALGALAIGGGGFYYAERAAAQAQIADGKRLAAILGCSGCHEGNLQGSLFVENPAQATIYASNLTRAVPGYSGAALERAIRGGVRADGTPLWGMPSVVFQHLDNADLAAVVAYLRSVPPAGPVHPRPAFGALGKAGIAAGKFLPAAMEVAAEKSLAPIALGDDHARARYWTRVTCAECHGGKLEGYAGDTPDLSIVAGYDRAAFHRLLRTGRPPDGRDLGLMTVVATYRFGPFSDAEVDAIYDYLVARAKAAG